jgi:hypothetical protein
MKNKKKVVIRNCCYYMEDVDDGNIFNKLRNNKNIDVTFIWETFVVQSKNNNGKENADHENEKLLKCFR